MPDYKVTWEIDIFNAANPREAAEQALYYQRDVDSLAVVFDVFAHDGDGEAVRVDLLDPDSPCDAEEV